VPLREIRMRRFSVVSARPFEETVDRLMETIGRPDMKAFHRALTDATNADEIAKVVGDAVGSSELMEFYRFDAGAVVSKQPGRDRVRMLRLLVGNPVIMKRMASSVPDAAAYAPVTILVDERADGVHLSYDSMASLLAPYGSATAQGVASELDEKVENLLEHAARAGE
jgi:uncharacterized protein (DUF302 family)